MSIGLTETQLADIPISMFNPIGLIERPSMDRLQVSLADIASRISSELDDLVVNLISSPTAEDFKASRKALFPSYIKLSTALSNIVLAKLDAADLRGLIEESLSALEAEVAEKASTYFGDEAHHELLFSIATLRSAYRWIPHLLAYSPAENARQEDMELALKFSAEATWSNFHLAGLIAALRSNRTILPEILQELLIGLRFSVMVYANVRAALELRNIPNVRYSEKLDSAWDEEDEALANAD
jgi:hypothetical protein